MGTSANLADIADPLHIIPQKGIGQRLLDPLKLAQRKKAPAPEPLKPLPTREDPEVLAARERLRLAELRRRGRTATNLTGGLGATGVSRPEAGAAQLLGD